MREKIVHLVNRITPTSIPAEVACKLGEEFGFEVAIVSLYDSQEEAGEKKEANNVSVPVIGIGLKNKISIKPYLNLLQVLRMFNPRIIHTHHTFSGVLGGLLGRFICRTSVVTTIHTDMRFLNTGQTLLRGITLNLSNFIIFNSHNTRASFSRAKRLIFRKPESRVIYNGVNIEEILSRGVRDEDTGQKANLREYFRGNISDYHGRKTSKYHRGKSGECLEENGSDNQPFLIGTVGRVEKPKDQQTLIKAFKLFKERVSAPVKLIIVGGGSLEKELKALAGEMGLGEEVVFTGLVPRIKAYQIINALDLFVVSSRYEGFCNAMVEAMAAGKPVIASDIQPLPEVLGEDNGLFFQVGNYGDLAEKILLLYNKDELRKELSGKAREYALQNYSLEKCVNEYAKVYRNLSK